MRILPLFIAFACILGLATNANAADTPEVRVYKQVDGQSLEVHLFLPQRSETPTPAIVWFYGSGFNQREPGQFYEHGTLLAKLGVASISTNIRGAAGKRPDRDIRPCIEDSRSAFRWVRAHAKELNIDPDRIAVGGGSSGGFLAAALATLSGPDDPADDLSIPIKPKLQILFNPWLGSAEGPKSEYPLANVKRGIAPAILFQGTADTTTPTQIAMAYRDLIREAGSRSEVMEYEGQKHGFFNYRGSLSYYYQTVGDMLQFLDEHGYLSY